MGWLFKGQNVKQKDGWRVEGGNWLVKNIKRSAFYKHLLNHLTPTN
jgi:hypothetical protein